MTARQTVEKHINNNINKENKIIDFKDINKTIAYEKEEDIERLLSFLK